jgi:hypothetical protein
VPNPLDGDVCTVAVSPERASPLEMPQSVDAEPNPRLTAGLLPEVE